jgi:hypothetical protein
MIADEQHSDVLVQYGRAGYVGRFLCTLPDTPARGARVVVETPRGLEAGMALCLIREQSSLPADGTLIRNLQPDEEERCAQLLKREVHLIAEAERLMSSATMPLTVLDVELLLDSSVAILHVLPHAACDVSPVLAELAANFSISIRLFDVTRTPSIQDPPEPSTSCGKPGCGSASGGCSSCGTEKSGCSTGGCSRGTVKSAAELSTYFAELRSKMEAHGLGRTPLI